METAIKALESMLEWSDRLGSDERWEIEKVITKLKKINNATKS